MTNIEIEIIEQMYKELLYRYLYTGKCENELDYMIRLMDRLGLTKLRGNIEMECAINYLEGK